MSAINDLQWNGVPHRHISMSAYFWLYYFFHSLIMNWAAGLFTSIVATSPARGCVWVRGSGSLATLQPGILCCFWAHQRPAAQQTSAVSQTAKKANLSKRALLLPCICKLLHHCAVPPERCQKAEANSSRHPLGYDSFQGGMLHQLLCPVEVPQTLIPSPCPFQRSSEMAPSQQHPCSMLCLRLH